jgi:hypothetical protein
VSERAPAPAPAKTTLSDLIASRPPAPPARPEVRRQGLEGPDQSGKTPAGYVDLRTLARSPVAQLELAAEIQQLYRGLGIEEIAIFRGTADDRPLLEITTNSEAAVFRTLEASAQVLEQLRERQPRRVAALEILMMTAARDRAGQFVLTPEIAGELLDRRADTAAFFVRHVQF